MNDQSEKIINRINWSAIFISAILSSLFTFLLLWSQIENKVVKAVNSNEVLEQIRSKVRPMMIFDQKETYKLDMGALKYIEDINVRSKGEFVDQITIKLKDPRPAPLITCLDDTVNYVITTKQGKKSEWIYKLEPRAYTIPRQKFSYFRLEILNGEAHNIQASQSDTEVQNVYFGTLARAPNSKEAWLEVSAPLPPDPKKIKEGATYFNSRKKRFMVYIDNEWKEIPILEDISKK